jgi:hypothetical protein
LQGYSGTPCEFIGFLAFPYPAVYRQFSGFRGARTMYKASRNKTLIANASARLTPDEQARIKQAAEAAGLTKSEWCRQALLEVLDATPGTRLLLSELLALRTVVVRLQADLLQDIEPSDTRLKMILDKADLDKFNLAENRIRTFRSQVEQKPKESAA